MSHLTPTPACPPRFATPRNFDRATLGPKVGEIAQRLGHTLMPWQQQVLDVSLEVADDGGLVYPAVVLQAPRQNGKTDLVLSKLVHRARAVDFFGGPQNMLYTAQDRNYARKKWHTDHVKRLQACTAYREGRDYDVRFSNGSEAIEWANGSRHGICAPTDAAGHSETLDEGVIDEAWAHETDQVEQGMSPAMITRRNSQFFVLSAAGTAKSFYLWRYVIAGREQATTGGEAIAYFEWSANEDDDPADPRSWARANPAFGFTITEAKLQSEYKKALLKGQDGVDLFRRAHMAVWPAVPVLDGDARVHVIPDDLWAGCLSPSSRASAGRAFAFHVGPDQAWAAISVASYIGDAVAHIEVVEHRPGTSWLVPRLAELKSAHKPLAVACDTATHAGTFVAELGKAGVTVEPITGRAHMLACSGLFADVVNGKVRHIGQPELDAALAGAVKRSVSDGYVWDAKSSAADITPLESVTLALMALKTAPVRRRPLVAAT